MATTSVSLETRELEICEIANVFAEATAGIEPAMKVLQTSALPLGYVA
jgi:hypothetical protein